MNILLQTRFPPSVGGIESLALILCREWRAMGHRVSVSTDVAAPPVQMQESPYPVYYQPTQKLLINLWREHDVVVMMNVSLKNIWPRLFLSKSMLLTHHGAYWISREEQRDWRERLKVGVARRCRYNLCVSDFVKTAIGLPEAHVVPNCYDDATFHYDGRAKRSGSMAFVGRLVSDKGVDLLLDAVSRLPMEIDWSLTIIGDGPVRLALETQAAKSAQSSRIRFTGSLRPELVSAALQGCEVLVVPSLWKEPFGIVALEGIACHCVPLVSDGGGLPEAVGEAGRSFTRGNAIDLTGQLCKLLVDHELRAALRAAGPAHLARHTARRIASMYLDLVENAFDKN